MNYIPLLKIIFTDKELLVYGSTTSLATGSHIARLSHRNVSPYTKSDMPLLKMRSGQMRLAIGTVQM